MDVSVEGGGMGCGICHDESITNDRTYTTLAANTDA
jgi:hypothetical protein